VDGNLDHSCTMNVLNTPLEFSIGEWCIHAPCRFGHGSLQKEAGKAVSVDHQGRAEKNALLSTLDALESSHD
jgi:hypothetical protein